MPYITKERKFALTGYDCDSPETAGELNFILTKIILEYLGDKPNYQKFNDAIGALEGCKLELYRRRVAGYEDEKIKINGDVY
jgi:hypothetical protein